MNKEQEIQKAKDFIEGKDSAEKLAIIMFTIKEIEGIMNLKDVKMCMVGEDTFNYDNKILLRSVALGMAASLGVAESLKASTV